MASEEPTISARPSSLQQGEKAVDKQPHATTQVRLFGVLVTVDEADADRLSSTALDAEQALKDQPDLLSRLDAVEREKATNTRAIQAVMRSCLAVMTTMDGQAAAHAAVRKLLDQAK